MILDGTVQRLGSRRILIATASTVLGVKPIVLSRNSILAGLGG